MPQIEPRAATPLTMQSPILTDMKLVGVYASQAVHHGKRADGIRRFV